MIGDLVATVDRSLGEAVAGGVVAHHERRLKRIGRNDVLHAPAGGWAAGDPPPREGCRLEVLVDGEEALPRIADELTKASSHVYLAGWQFSPAFALRRGHAPVVLRNLLAELAENLDVHVLAWAGAPLPLFRPSRRTVRAARDELCRGTRVRCALDARERPLHCHHEKTIVVDDRVAFVGGIDLTAASGDRFDSSAHVARAEVGWHDVSTRIEGPAVSDVSEHFRMRWHEVTGERLLHSGPPTPDDAGPSGPHTIQIVRTVPERIYAAEERGDFRILETYLRGLRVGHVARLPREPVPLVAGNRSRATRQARTATMR